DLPLSGSIILTVHDRDKPTVVPIARRLHDMGFRLLASEGTARHLQARGIPCDRVLKVSEGRPNMVDLMIWGQVGMLITPPLGKQSQYDDRAMRRAAISNGIPYMPTMAAASAGVNAISALRDRPREVKSVQERIAS